uniref:HAT C-terminal dimerisation domain-containing protein n=1 Tax=Opuntia streptacantha TaxID=393608 RepID=A0A7C8ZFM1_OPUST
MDVLNYWSTNQCRFPILSQMARDVLTIPLSTVTSESAFSVGGRLLDAFHSSLKPKTVEAVICLRDWAFGQEALMLVQCELDELCGDVIKLNCDDEEGEVASNEERTSNGAAGSGTKQKFALLV